MAESESSHDCVQEHPAGHVVTTSSRSPQIQRLSDFAGVWRRVKLFEPKDVLTHHEDPSIRLVLWLQSSCGIFVDLRVDLPNITFISSSKSFAGEIEYDKATSHITWRRIIDYRPLSPPDIGKVHFISENILQEDSVMEEDDFIEIWERDQKINKNETVAVELNGIEGTLTENRRGFFVIVGDWFGYSLCRDEAESLIRDHISQDEIFNCFDKPIESEKMKHYLLQHITVVGRTIHWNVIYSLDPDMTNQSLLDPKGYLFSTLFSMKWNVIEGVVPELIQQHIQI